MALKLSEIGSWTKLESILLYRRFWGILLGAPWAIVDLILSSLSFWIGVLFVVDDFSEEACSTLIFKMIDFVPFEVWGVIFIIFGCLGFYVVLVSRTGGFVLWWVMRLGVVIPMMVMTSVSLASRPLQVIGVVFLVLTVVGGWGLVRTKPGGG